VVDVFLFLFFPVLVDRHLDTGGIRVIESLGKMSGSDFGENQRVFGGGDNEMYGFGGEGQEGGDEMEVDKSNAE
jgi:hypothetical protein